MKISKFSAYVWSFCSAGWIVIAFETQRLDALVVGLLCGGMSYLFMRMEPEEQLTSIRTHLDTAAKRHGTKVSIGKYTDSEAEEYYIYLVAEKVKGGSRGRQK
jgi:hypothetical protein